MADHQKEIQFESSLWFWMLVLIGACLVKGVIFQLDNRPQFFLGDSGVYINTALTDSHPNDRSYWYGVLIRWISVNSQSLQPLLLFQTACGVMSALASGFIANRIFPGNRPIIWMTVVLCALDPVQLLFERYILTESIALLAFSGLLASLVLIMSGGSWKYMLGAACSCIALIFLRSSFFPAIICALFFAPLFGLIAKKISLTELFYCFLISASTLSICWSTTSSLKTGQVVLAAWSPLLTSDDFPNKEQGERFMEGMNLQGKDFFNREITLFRPDGMIQRIRSEISDPDELDKFSKKVAFNILRRDFWGVLNLSTTSYGKVWGSDYRMNLMKWDIGQNELQAPFRDLLREKFHLEAEELPSPTLTSNLYLSLGHKSVLLALIAPLLFVLLATLSDRRSSLIICFIGLISAALLITIFTLSTLPVIRYLHPICWMVSTLLPAFIIKYLILKIPKK